MTFEIIVILCVLISLSTNMFMLMLMLKHLKAFGKQHNDIDILKEKIKTLENLKGVIL
jgi:hypothetical protein